MTVWLKARARIGPLLTRPFHLYWRFSRGMTLGVRGLVLNDAREVFLIKHSYTPGWHLPGGGVEPGESMLEALGRELLEEGNIVATERPALHGVFFNSHISRRDHVAVYVVRAFRQDRAPRPDHEIIDHGFFAADKLPADTTGGTRRRIAEALEGAPVAEFW